MMQQLNELQNLEKSIMNRRVIGNQLRKEQHIEKIREKVGPTKTPSPITKRRTSSVKRSLGLTSPILISPEKPQTTLFEKKTIKLLSETPTPTPTPTSTPSKEASYTSSSYDEEETLPPSYATQPLPYETESEAEAESLSPPPSYATEAEAEEEDMNESSR